MVDFQIADGKENRFSIFERSSVGIGTCLDCRTAIDYQEGASWWDEGDFD